MNNLEQLDAERLNYVESLSVLNKKQLEIAAAQGSIDKLDPKATNLPDFFKNYAYTLNPMPVFINQAVVQQMSECVAAVPGLIHDLLRVHFNNNAEKIADYFRITLADAQALIDFDFHPHFFSRFDLIHSSGQFKIVELNMGSKLGGWEIGAFEGLYRSTAHLQALSEQGCEFHYRVALQQYVQQLLQSCVGLNLFDEQGTIRIVFLLDQSSLGKYVDTDFVGQLFYGVAQAMGLKVDVQFAIDVKDFSFVEDNLYYQGLRVSAFNNGREEQKDDIDLAAINQIFYRNRLVQTDSPICTFFQDKRTLALLSQLAQSGAFSAEKAALIERFIPWGACAEFEQVSYQSEQWPLRQLLVEKREDMVIKQAYGRGQGQGVYVGRYVDEQTWQQAIELLFNEPGYFVQGFCQGEAIISSTDAEHCQLSNCDAVWGVFGFNKTFGGAGIRLVAQSNNDDGVINCATGAQDTLVYEAQQ